MSSVIESFICEHCGEENKCLKETLSEDKKERIYLALYTRFKNNMLPEKVLVGSRFNHLKNNIVRFICFQCSKLVVVGTQDDIIKIKWKHTNKKGEWSKEELPEEKRDSRIIQTHLLNKI